jgi:ribose/xylose/arabinose/galactoside ABC-type transport system permease subunit
MKTGKKAAGVPSTPSVDVEKPDHHHGGAFSTIFACSIGGSTIGGLCLGIAGVLLGAVIAGSIGAYVSYTHD